MGLDLDFTYPIHIDLAIAARLIIGCVLLAAGIFKVRRQNQTHQFIRDVGFTANAVRSIYVVTVALELSTGLLLIAGVASAAAVSSLLFTSFVVALVRTRRVDKPCGCLGSNRSSHSLFVRLLFRFAGVAGSIVILIVPGVGRTPSVLSILIAAFSLGWILRPRRSPVEAGVTFSGETEPGASHGESADVAAIRSVTRKGASEVRVAARGLPEFSTTLASGVNRRAALQRAMGMATLGAVVPVTRLGNLLGYTCCSPDPCPRNFYCDQRHPYGGCYCEPEPTKPTHDHVRDVADQALPPPPDPPPCNCKCQFEECMESYGYPSGWDCVNQCGFFCTPPYGTACAITAASYVYCEANCVTGPTMEEAVTCAAQHQQCCAGNPNDPTCSRPGLFGSQFTLGPGLEVPDDLSLWRARAGIVSALYIESVVPTVLDVLGKSTLFDSLERDLQASIRSDLDQRSRKLLERTTRQRRMFSDRFVRAGIDRNRRLAQDGLSTGRKLDQEDVSSPTGHLKKLSVRGARPGETASPQSSPGPSAMPLWRSGPEVCLKELETRRRIATALAIPEGSLPATLATEWERDLKRLQRVTRWQDVRSTVSGFASRAKSRR
jgi:uncharacterized membrane protein YphA (DoxX/SURF4 family)